MAYYNAIANGYNELYQEEQLKKLLLIKINIIINKNIRILDVGCGTGISSDFDCFVVGIDPSIELLRQNKSDKKFLGCAETLPFKDGSFDYVVSVTSIHNFKNIKSSIEEIKRVCREKAVLSILKKSKKFDTIKRVIKGSFIVEKMIDEGKDIIFFCKNHKHNIYIYK